MWRATWPTFFKSISLNQLSCRLSTINSELSTIYDREPKIHSNRTAANNCPPANAFTSRANFIPTSACRCAKSASPTRSLTPARSTPNEPVRVYDCTGPWGDPNFTGKSDEGLPALRREWILKRGDVEEYDGREVKPMDNGYLSGKHAEFASKAEKNRLVEFPGLHEQPPTSAARQGRQGCHPAFLRPRRHHHARDGIHRHPREHGPGQFTIDD